MVEDICLGCFSPSTQFSTSLCWLASTFNNFLSQSQGILYSLLYFYSPPSLCLCERERDDIKFIPMLKQKAKNQHLPSLLPQFISFIQKKKKKNFKPKIRILSTKKKRKRKQILQNILSNSTHHSLYPHKYQVKFKDKTTIYAAQ